MRDVLIWLLSIPAAVAKFAADLVAQIVMGAFGLAMLVGIYWLVDRVTAPMARRIERSSWWARRFGFRYGFWDIAAPALLGTLFAAPVIFVAWGYATGRLPAH